MNGPCLCGDPYCSSCGNPAAAEFADIMEDHCEMLEGFLIAKEEFQIFSEAGKAAVLKQRRESEEVEGEGESLDDGDAWYMELVENQDFAKDDELSNGGYEVL
jgi:hypothetical protein